MNSLINDNRKFIIFWNPKCACSYLKSVFLEAKGEFPGKIEDTHEIIGYGYPHTPYSYLDPNKVDQYSEYVKLLFVRDPYKRLVSGFVEKIPKWIKEGKLSPNYCRDFKDFLYRLKQDNFCVYNGDILVDSSHFDPQFSGDFKIIRENNWKFSNVYDISALSKIQPVFTALFGKQIDDSTIVDLGKVHSSTYSNTLMYGAHSVPVSTWLETKVFPNYKSFYTDKNIIETVNRLYYDDFNNLIKLGFNYTI